MKWPERNTLISRETDVAILMLFLIPQGIIPAWEGATATPIQTYEDPQVLYQQVWTWTRQTEIIKAKQKIRHTTDGGKVKTKLCLPNANSLHKNSSFPHQVLKRLCIFQWSRAPGFLLSKSSWSRSSEMKAAPSYPKANLMSLPSSYRGREPPYFKSQKKQKPTHLSHKHFKCLFIPLFSITSAHSDFAHLKIIL